MDSTRGSPQSWWTPRATVPGKKQVSSSILCLKSLPPLRISPKYRRLFGLVLRARRFSI